MRQNGHMGGFFETWQSRSAQSTHSLWLQPVTPTLTASSRQMPQSSSSSRLSSKPRIETALWKSTCPAGSLNFAAARLFLLDLQHVSSLGMKSADLSVWVTLSPLSLILCLLLFASRTSTCQTSCDPSPWHVLNSLTFCTSCCVLADSIADSHPNSYTYCGDDVTHAWNNSMC